MILAHGVGARADLPLPVWLFAYSASFALLISFVALRLLWPRPRLEALAAGVEVGGGMSGAIGPGQLLVRIVTSTLFSITVIAVVIGPDSVAENIAPTALYIVLWVGMQVVSVVVGDVWRDANPLWLLSAGLDRLRGRDPHASTATGWWATHWPAAVGLLAFQWLELAYHRPASIDAVAVFVLGYSGAVVVAGAVFGAGWVRTGDGFAVLFTLLASLAPIGRVDGRWRLRVPGSGLSTVVMGPGTLGVILVVLGGTTFDGVTRTQFWSDLVGARRDWDRTLVHTAGLVVTIAVVAAVYAAATHAVARIGGDDDAGRFDRWGPSLIPIVFAYSVAHYFSLLVFEGQAFLRLLSDPWGSGWDLFGTAQNRIDFTVVSPNQIAYVQVTAIVVGHILGVIAAHDRAVDRYSGKVAVTSQYPLLAVMIAYTSAGLLLLLNA